MATQRQLEHEREHARQKLFQPAELRVGGDAIRVHVLDISQGGARLHVPAGLTPGSRVMLTLAGQPRSATVAWSIGAKCGVRFVLPLASSQLAALIAAGPASDGHAVGRPAPMRI